MKTNTDTKVETISDYMAGKSIACCVTGGIAAIRTPEIVRHLRRHGAEVTVYLSDEAKKMVGEVALEWASEKTVVTSLTGKSEHIIPYDAILLCPATTNTISKFALGIADTPLLSLLASALGAKTSIIVVPTMHDSLFDNPFLQKHVLSLQNEGVHFLPSRVSEGKRKIPRTETIVASVSHIISSHSIKGKKVLVTGGPTPVLVDSVRVITNVFKGRTGLELAKDAYYKGAQVKLLLGSTGIPVPDYIDTLIHRDYTEYFENVFSNLKNGYDIAIFSAAVADYTPINPVKGKISSQGALKEIKLTTTAKVIKEVRKQFPKLFMVTFKYECGISKEKLLTIARNRLVDGYQLVVANRDVDMKVEHSAFLCSLGGVRKIVGKRNIAKEVLDESMQLLGGVSYENN